MPRAANLEPRRCCSSLRRPASSLTRGFTLVELLITVAVIGIMAGMMLFATYRAMESGKEQKTRALIAKLDTIIRAKWDAYQTRRVPVAPLIDEPFTDSNGNGAYDITDPYTDSNGNGVWDYTSAARARVRLDALRDLMRMELPDRYSDIVRVNSLGGGVFEVTSNQSVVQPIVTWPYSTVAIAPPAVFQGFLRRISAAVASASPPTIDHQGAEMLYLIVSASLSDDEDAGGLLKADNVGDTDGDGMPELLDGWGRPIYFLRWPAGYLSERNALAEGTLTRKFPGTPPSTVILGFARSALPQPGGFSNTKLPDSEPSFAGCTLARVYPGTHLLHPSNQQAQITSYGLKLDSSTGQLEPSFTFEVPSGQIPFASGAPIPPGDFIVLDRDRSDPQGIYPIYPAGTPDFSQPTWNIEPLIYSAGRDGKSGIAAGGGTLHFVDQGLNPFFNSGSTMLGTLQDDSGGYGDPGTGLPYVDNIDNQQLN